MSAFRVADRGGATDPTELSVVARAGEGDARAFGELVTTRLDRVFRMACAIMGNEADARDVTQDAFVAAWMHLPTLRDQSRFDAWLNRLVLNRCRDALRRRQRRREVNVDGMELEVADPANRADDVAAVSAALDRLSPSDRQILVLHHLDDLPVAGVARQLGIPVGTAKWRLHRARRALERGLEAES